LGTQSWSLIAAISRLPARVADDLNAASNLPFPGHRADTRAVSPIAELIIAILLPTAAGYAIIAVVRGGRRLSQARCEPTPPEPVEQLAARLRRLRAQLEQTEAQPGITAKGHKVRALRGAYVDVLTDACARFEVVPPKGGDRAELTEIYRVEAALRAHGLDVRQTAMR
jgi:hypothetical protein